MEHFSTFSWLTFIECQNSLISYTLIFSGSLSGQDLVQILIVQGALQAVLEPFQYVGIYKTINFKIKAHTSESGALFCHP
jgi:hypothetical protein